MCKFIDFSPVRSGLMSFWSRFQLFHLIPSISCEMFLEFERFFKFPSKLFTYPFLSQNYVLRYISDVVK